MNRRPEANVEAVHDDLIARVERIAVEAKAMSPGQRDKEIIRLVGLSTEGIIRAAAILKVKEELLEDIQALGLGSLGFILLRVAHGMARPEIVQRFHGRLGLARKITTYSPRDQAKIVEGGLPLVTFLGGERTVIKVDPANVENSDQLNQLFDRDGIRSESQQIIYLDKKDKEARRPETERVGPAEIDVEQKFCTIKGVRLSKELLIRILEVMG